ncbi:hypothetical protein RM572_00645 [Streptomyces sp. DSM 42041]|uniref:Uncharacterized protein n=1 Tax=Streptomyces hazeniae TaxID=3075538 RepID=A0ABU2NKM2_9ACTN|nr:hypothetical protein [Streptomyces sp. DSM 42041]MDT0377284.1 hypothetical protein [Streptomyces sp. DSM 42041]
MTTATPGDVEQTAEQAAKYHHAHYQGTGRNRYGRVVFAFAPFTGNEEEPIRPRDSYRDDDLPDAARDLLTAEYDAARRLWWSARYVRDLKTATTEAPALWDAYQRAQQHMTDLRRTLDTTPDTYWTSTVSQLVDAQDKALDAARDWDDLARGIARVHDDYVYSDLAQHEAYERAGVETDGWVVGCTYDYDAYCGAPLTRIVREAVQKQRTHVQQVSQLTTRATG